MSKVAITSCSDYSQENLSKAIELVVSNTDFPNIENKTVLLKPNVLSDAPVEDAITTHPEFLRAVIRLCKQRGAKEILVGDSPGMATPGFVPKSCGLAQICLDEGVKWVDFFKDSHERLIPGTKTKLLICGALDKADVLISLPKLKTHQLMYCTGSIKNLFGLVPGLHKSPCHLLYSRRESFARLLCGIYELAKPSYALMDSVIAMEGPGPANGSPKPLGLIMGSSDCPGLDYTQAFIMGYKPNLVPLIAELKRRRLLEDDIQYTLEQPHKVDSFKLIKVTEKTHFMKALALPFFTRGFMKAQQKKEVAPQFKPTCHRCLKCVHICPAHALTLNLETDKKPVIDKTKCIRCYCCHEVCPFDCIFIEKK